jgi:ubiquinone/menaquinone biosynthesis C-methylase UbiE
MGDNKKTLSGPERDRKESEKKFWSWFAPRYDRFVDRQVKSYTTLANKVLDEVRRDWTVLEVAAGTGQITLEVAGKAREVYAVDITPQMIAVAQQKAKTRGIGNVRFAVEDAYRLPFDGSSFDAVICSNALHNMREPRRALSEMNRVLRPSGVLIAPTICHGQGLRSRMISRLMSAFGFPAYHRFTPDSLTRLIEGAGFKIERREVIPERIPMAFVVGRKK